MKDKNKEEVVKKEDCITNKELLEAAKPLMKLINDKGHPHMTVILTSMTVELCEGVAVGKTEEYLND